MLRLALALGLVVSFSQQVLADEAPYQRPWHYRHGWHLPRERHVIEVVQPPYSGIFIINGIRFTGMTPACFRWVAGDPIGLVAGDWHGHCILRSFIIFGVGAPVKCGAAELSVEARCRALRSSEWGYRRGLGSALASRRRAEAAAHLSCR